MILLTFLKLIVNYIMPIFIIAMLIVFAQMVYLYFLIKSYKKYEDKKCLEKIEKNITKINFLQKTENHLIDICNILFLSASIISFFVIGLKVGLLMLFINFIITAMLIFFKTKVIPECFSDLN